MKKLLSLLLFAAIGLMAYDETINLQELTADYVISDSRSYLVTSGTDTYGIIITNGNPTLNISQMGFMGSRSSFIQISKGGANNVNVTLNLLDTDPLGASMVMNSGGHIVEVGENCTLTITGDGWFNIAMGDIVAIGPPAGGQGGNVVMSSGNIGIMTMSASLYMFIGALNGESFGNVTITGGFIQQQGKNAPVIGAVAGGSLGDVLISGGTLFISTNSEGGMFQNCNSLTITGGSLCDAYSAYGYSTTGIGMQPYNSSSEKVYCGTLPGVCTEEDTTYTFDVKNSGGTYMTYSGKGYTLFKPQKYDFYSALYFYLPNGFFTTKAGSKTYGCTIANGPSTFTEVPEPALLGGLLLLAIGFLRRK